MTDDYHRLITPEQKREVPLTPEQREVMAEVVRRLKELAFNYTELVPAIQLELDALQDESYPSLLWEKVSKMKERLTMVRVFLMYFRGADVPDEAAVSHDAAGKPITKKRLDYWFDHLLKMGAAPLTEHRNFLKRGREDDDRLNDLNWLAKNKAFHVAQRLFDNRVIEEFEYEMTRRGEKYPY